MPPASSKAHFLISDDIPVEQIKRKQLPAK